MHLYAIRGYALCASRDNQPLECRNKGALLEHELPEIALCNAQKTHSRSRTVTGEPSVRWVGVMP